MSPAPLLNHQEVLLTLGSAISNYVKKKKIGKVYISPVDVFFDDKNAYQPDIVFVSTKKEFLLQPDGIYGAPDLVIEVLSPGTRQFDLKKKKNVYEKSGVQEYWVVDPFTHLCTCFTLTNGKYKELSEQKAQITSPLLKHTFTL